MRKILVVFLLTIAHYAVAQGQVSAATDAFTITGKVKADRTVTLRDLQQYAAVELADVNISCSPKKEDKVKTLKGVLLKNILDSVRFDYEKSSFLNRYYFLFVAADGYKTVFSFNEVYNTEVGNNLYIVTEIGGKSVQDVSNRVLMLSTKDIKSGGRNMKWLTRIVVCSAE